MIPRTRVRSCTARIDAIDGGSARSTGDSSRSARSSHAMAASRSPIVPPRLSVSSRHVRATVTASSSRSVPPTSSARVRPTLRRLIPSSAPTRSWVQAVASSGVARSRPGLGGIGGGAILSPSLARSFLRGSVPVSVRAPRQDQSRLWSAGSFLRFPRFFRSPTTTTRCPFSSPSVIVPLDVSRGGK